MDTTDLRRVFRLSKNQADVLDALLVEKQLSTEELAFYSVQPRLMIRNMRKKLAEFDIRIESLRDLGYWLDEEGKDRVRKLAEGHVEKTG